MVLQALPYSQIDGQVSSMTVQSVERTLVERYAGVKARLFAPRVVTHPPIGPVDTKKVVILPWAMPTWMQEKTRFNQHIIDYMQWRLAEESGLDAPLPRPRSMMTIATEALSHYPGVTLQEVRGPRRFRRIVEARQYVMYRIYAELPDVSLPMIGRFLGGKDHTTILHAVRKLEPIFGEIAHRRKGSE